MIFVWRGKGLLVPIFGFLGMTLVVALGRAVNDFHSKLGSGLVVFACGLAAAIPCWLVGVKVNDPRRDRIVIDRETGQEIVLSVRHHFMFIPMQYYAFLYLAFFTFGAFNQK